MEILWAKFFGGLFGGLLLMIIAIVHDNCHKWIAVDDNCYMVHDLCLHTIVGLFGGLPLMVNLLVGYMILIWSIWFILWF